MRQSKLFLTTKKETPKEVKIISHKLLIRGDFIEQTISGVYRFLPLGWRVLKKIEKIIREEMVALGAQELYLPTLQNKNLWLETGRWTTIDPPLFKLRDRHQKEIALAPTHEEEITDIIRKRVKSYKDLPIYLFQIQNKFRNEIRPSGGLLRTVEFLMKDLYSFHSDENDLENFYQKVKKSYFKIFNRCSLKALCVEASSGTIGGELSNEFMVLSEVGEDKILFCPNCHWGANIEKSGDIKECPQCKKQLEKKNSIEVGHIFKLGSKYSESMKATFKDKEGKEKPIIMGCYGIGLPRLMGTIVEIHHDEKGIIWPKEVAPFDVHLIEIKSLNTLISKKIKKTAEKIYKNLQNQKIEVLYDDRDDKTPGEKLIDSDLIGIPIRIVVSEKTLKRNCVEIKKRKTKKIELIKIKNIESFIKNYF